uniref:Shroud n=1 Tax=Eotetranychus kankitus TaxID=2137873 RepID=A0A5P9NYT7_9ACAR|nr:shroud [Eotetranychus kankitus]
MTTLRLPMLIFPLSFCLTFWIYMGLPLISWLISVTATTLVIAISAWKLSCFLSNITQGTLDPSNKAVLITGCDSGFGYVTALELNEKGFNVLAGVKNIHGKGAKDLADNCKYSERMNLIELDVTRDENDLARDLIDRVTSILSSSGDCLWALVNNAGLLTVGPIDWGDYASSIEPLVNVNLLGSIKMTRIFLPLLKQSTTSLSPSTGGHGIGARIVNMSSIQGKLSLPWTPIYATTKSAINFYSNCLRLNVNRFGIKVTTILPYKYRTPMGQTEQLVDSLETNWTTSSGDVKSSYGDFYYHRLRQLLEKVNNSGPESGDPKEIASKVYQCLVTPDPPNEIICSPWCLRPLWFLVRFMPQELIDLLFDFIETNYLQV